VKRVKSTERELQRRQRWNDVKQTIRFTLADKIPGDVTLVIETIHHTLLQILDDGEAVVATTMTHLHARAAEIAITTTRTMTVLRHPADAVTAHRQTSNTAQSPSQPVATPNAVHAAATTTPQKKKTTVHADTAASKMTAVVLAATTK
jgi:hypothetical protein